MGVHAVNLGEMKVCQEPDSVLAAYGIGSCVVICIFDPKVKIAGMLHALLPTNPSQVVGEVNPYKYVDQGVPLLISAIEKRGGQRRDFLTFLCGGASVLRTPVELGPLLQIGERNVVAARAVLKEERLRIKVSDVGGEHGRTVRFFVENGRLTIRTLAQEHVLYAGYGQRR
ncbi:MAG TPA: chemotaxis protein CheD [Anaerolineae bacterium]|nr:chemotaxis protein CheD [Anaerolineae bacterium]